MLSDWLLENIDTNNLISNKTLSVVKPSAQLRGSYEDYTEYTKYTAYYEDYSEHNRYSVYYEDYTRHSEYYYQDYTDNYNNYMVYVDDYSNSYYNYSNYSDYNNYSNYSDYVNTCVVNCQICNTCQTQCQINQYAYYYVGHQMSFNNNLDFVESEDYNALIDYINSAAVVCDLNINLNNFKVVDGEIVQTGIFNTINSAIQQFIDGTTGYSNKVAQSNIILTSEMEHFKDVLNQVKISPTKPCCQTVGHETCITRQDY